MADETADMDACLRQVKKLSDRYERLSQCAGMYQLDADDSLEAEATVEANNACSRLVRLKDQL